MNNSMRNKYNLLVAILVLICLAEASYRTYKAYQKFMHPEVTYHEVSK